MYDAIVIALIVYCHLVVSKSFAALIEKIFIIKEKNITCTSNLFSIFNPFDIMDYWNISESYIDSIQEKTIYIFHGCRFNNHMSYYTYKNIPLPIKCENCRRKAPKKIQKAAFIYKMQG